MSSEPMVIFTRTYDFISWLIPRTIDFPRSQRFVVTGRLQAAALDFQERIIRANHLQGHARLEQLNQADASLAMVRLYLRLVYRWQWLSEGQYYHAARMVKEVGDLLGGWINQTMEVCGIRPRRNKQGASRPGQGSVRGGRS